LLARANAVAKAVGDNTARGRIGSLRFMRDGVDTFEEWWSGASPNEKARLITDKKHLDSFQDSWVIRLSDIMDKCPFRGPVPKPSEEEEEEDEKEPRGKATSQALVHGKKGGPA